MLNTKDYALHCDIKCFFHKTPQVMASYLVNGTNDIYGLPVHLGKKKKN